MYSISGLYDCISGDSEADPQLPGAAGPALSPSHDGEHDG